MLTVRLRGKLNAQHRPTYALHRARPYRRGRHLRSVTLDSPRCGMKQDDYRRSMCTGDGRCHIKQRRCESVPPPVFQPPATQNVPIMSIMPHATGNPNMSPKTVKRWPRLAATPSTQTASSSTHSLDRALHPLSPLSIGKTTDTWDARPRRIL